MQIQTEQVNIISEASNTGAINSLMHYEQPIFSHNFKVHDMRDPQQYLQQYNTNKNRDRSFVQDCNTCCGDGCICCAYPFALCCCKCCCVYELPTATAGIIEEFGKFKRLINPGFNMINPCSEDVREVDMRIKLLSVGINHAITKDNVKVTITSAIAYRVVNPIQVYYILANALNRALIQTTHGAIRNVIGENILDDVLTKRSTIVYGMKKFVQSSMPPGVHVENIFIQDIVVPHQTMAALSSAAKQKRISQANIINSKADVESASLLKEAADLLDTKAAMQIRYLEMVTEIGKRGAKLMMPIGVNKKGFKE